MERDSRHCKENKFNVCSYEVPISSFCKMYDWGNAQVLLCDHMGEADSFIYNILRHLFSLLSLFWLTQGHELLHKSVKFFTDPQLCYSQHDANPAFAGVQKTKYKRDSGWHWQRWIWKPPWQGCLSPQNLASVSQVVSERKVNYHHRSESVCFIYARFRSFLKMYMVQVSCSGIFIFIHIHNYIQYTHTRAAWLWKKSRLF